MMYGKKGARIATGLGTALAVERFQSGIQGDFDTSEFTQLGLGVIIKDLVLNGTFDKLLRNILSDLQIEGGADVASLIYQYPAYVVSFMASRLILGLQMNVKKNLKDGIIFMITQVIVEELMSSYKSK